MTLVPRFLNLLAARGSNVRYKRDQSMIPCPCRTPEGFRDPAWHLQQPLPSPPMCNEAGLLPDPGSTVDVTVKAFVQPIQSTRATRLQTEQLMVLMGEIQMDDHLGIFPCVWAGIELDFHNWSRAGEDFIEYEDRRFIVVNSNLIPDPSDGLRHHWEVGLRLVTDAPL